MEQPPLIVDRNLAQVRELLLPGLAHDGRVLRARDGLPVDLLVGQVVHDVPDAATEHRVKDRDALGADRLLLKLCVLE